MNNIPIPINAKDLTGKRFGKLVVLKYAGRQKINNRFSWLCKCDCGKNHIARSTALMCGGIKSCGCNKRRKTILQLTGRRFGKLLVLGPQTIGKCTSYWRCKCDCGNEVSIVGGWLNGGGRTSCGCKRAETLRNKPAHFIHGRTHTTEYKIYHGALNRCTNPNNNQYFNYGGRGIQFNFSDFGQFYKLLGPRPSLGHSLDRIDVNGNYEPGNVRWATWEQQARNKRCDNCTKLKTRILELEHKLESLGTTSLDS